MRAQRFKTSYVLALPQSADMGDPYWEIGATGGLPNAIATSVTVRPSSPVALGSEAPPPWPSTKAVVVPWTADIAWDFQMPSAVTMTAGGYVIERHPQGIRSRNVTISGDVLPISLPQEVFGKALDASMKSLLTAPPQATYSASWRVLVQMINLIEEVQRSQTGILHLYAVDEAYYYEVEPRGLRLVRGGRNRTGVRYELTLKALRKVDRPPYSATSKAVRLANPSNPFADAVKAVKAARDGINQAMRRARAMVVANVFGPAAGVQSMLSNAIGIASDVVDEFNEYTLLISGVTHAPANMALKVKSLLTKGEQAVSELKRATVDWAKNEGWGFRHEGVVSAAKYLRPEPGVDANARKAREALLANHEAQSALERMALVGRLAAQAAEPRQEYWPVRAQDTIYTLAAAVLGDAGRWQELVTRARLSPPYVSATGAPGTLQPGDRLPVPSRQGASDAAATIRSFGAFEGRYVPEDELLFGRDWRLTSDGDLAEAPGSRTGAGLDVDTVAGAAALEQTINSRMRTLRGTNLIHRNVGLPAAVGMRATDDLLAAFVVDGLWQLQADDRVARIEGYVVEDAGNAVGLKATVVPRNAAAFEVRR